MFKIKSSNPKILSRQIVFIFIYFAIIFAAYYIINIDKLKNFSYTFLIYLFFLFIPPKMQPIRLTIFGLFNFILGIELFFNLRYGYITESLLKTALENDTNQSYLMIKHEFFAILLPAFIFSLIYTYYIYNKIKISCNNKILYWSIIFACSFFLLKNTLYYYLSDRRHIVEFKVDPFFSINKSVRVKYPVVIGNSSILLIDSLGFSEKYTNAMEHENFNHSIINSHNENTFNKYKNIIFILGESAYRGRHNIYGYNKNTTPEMHYIFTQPNSCIVKDVHSPSSITRDSIPMLFSFAKPNDEQPLLREKNIIELANFQNYNTSWISKNGESGPHSSKYSIIAKLSNIFIEELQDDLDLPKQLIETNFQNNEKNFIVVHLAGSHKPYKLGYDEIDTLALPDADDYDRTIYHSDRVIKEVYTILKEKLDDFILIYTPDHGEIVNLGHGLLRKSKEFSNQFEIPLMIYSSYDNYPCQEIENYRNDNQMINTSNLVYLLSNLLGYSVNIDQSFISEDLILSVDGKSYEYLDIIKQYQQ
ncbi:MULTISPECIES: phosphoethanolamine transferase [unclassified Gilliamella]|uniref:phosphoethanolamine transferase n=1 Tax=unclassified Gilliamella TaxID=2685620 RepID=UPI00226AE03F|nr:MULTISPECIES: phosphoethanolamine transferase [unclassified Gilliamella]MCX8583372.1 phosphoethanolamine transferase [Gilliamella sp. B3372]MCX8593789.1 phosphoethanolamine transferase [Gilliamella sp. B3367]